MHAADDPGDVVRKENIELEEPLGAKGIEKIATSTDVNKVCMKMAIASDAYEGEKKKRPNEEIVFGSEDILDENVIKKHAVCKDLDHSILLIPEKSTNIGIKVAIEFFNAKSTHDFVDKKLFSGSTDVDRSFGAEEDRTPTIYASRDYCFCLPWTSPAVAEGNHTAIGRWGEALVYQFLLFTRCEFVEPRHPCTVPYHSHTSYHRSEDSVVWLNSSIESCAAYDIMITSKVQGLKIRF